MSESRETYGPKVAETIGEAESIKHAIRLLRKLPQDGPIPESSVDEYKVQHVTEAFEVVDNHANKVLPESLPEEEVLMRFTGAHGIRAAAADVIAEECLERVNDDGFVIHYLADYGADT